MELNNLTTTALKTAMLVVLGRDETEDWVSDLIDVIEFVAEKGEEVTIFELEILRRNIGIKNTERQLSNPNIKLPISRERERRTQNENDSTASPSWPPINNAPTTSQVLSLLGNRDGTSWPPINNAPTISGVNAKPINGTTTN